MTCFGCDRDGVGLLISGLCEACAPGLHAGRAAHLAAYAAARRDFVAETGLDPLRDYEAFDRWCALRWRGPA